jgi:hypothetical protein
MLALCNMLILIQALHGNLRVYLNHYLVNDYISYAENELMNLWLENNVVSRLN